MPNHQKASIFAILVFFCMVLCACAGQVTTQPFTLTPQIPQKVTTKTKTPTEISQPREPSPSNSPTVTGKLAGTSAPFIHSSDTPAFNQHTNTTATTQPTSTELPELALKETQIASFSVDCNDDNFKYHASLSPKENWLAISCEDKKDRNETLKIYGRTGKKWVLQFKDYVDKHFIDNGPLRGSLYPIRWTSDEEYLYFGSALGISAGGTCFYGGSGQGLYRFNVDNGTVVAILPPLMGGDLYLLSFSPSGHRLAYTTGVPTVLDLQTGEEIILQEGNNKVGDFTWSPDGSYLAYSTCLPSVGQSNVLKSAIRVFSLETHETKTILQTEAKDEFLRIDLVDENHLKIYDGNSRFSDDYLNFFDWSLGRLYSPTFTPTP